MPPKLVSAISAPAVEDFRSIGFVLIHSALSSDIIRALEVECTAVAEERWRSRELIRDPDDYQLAFDYSMNVWHENATIRSLILSPQLGKLAAILLGVPSVRLSHDQVLFKRPHSPRTPVHADQYHWPVSSCETLTFWLPLHDILSEHGPLNFFRGSHRMLPKMRNDLFRRSSDDARDLLIQNGFDRIEGTFAAGDISAHYGWTFHDSAENSTDVTRKAYSVVYMASDIKLVTPEYGPPLELLHSWCPGAQVGNQLNHDFNPIVHICD